MDDWISLDITNASDREAVALALFRAGYTVRRRKRRDGNKTVVFLEYLPLPGKGPVRI